MLQSALKNCNKNPTKDVLGERAKAGKLFTKKYFYILKNIFCKKFACLCPFAQEIFSRGFLQFFNADCNMLQQWEKKLQIILDYSSLSNFSSDGNLFIFKRGANQLEKVLTVVVSCFLFKIVGNSELFWWKI